MTETPTRSCGSCTLCCKLFPVPDLNKLTGRWCQHIAQGKGCAIHETRPQVCRAFFCQWIYNDELGPEWKPDHARFVLSIYPGTNSLAVTTDPGAPNAWKREPYYRDLKRWAEAALKAGDNVLVFTGSKVTILLPDRDVELGELQPGDQIRVGRRGPVYEAAVLRAEQGA